MDTRILLSVCGMLVLVSAAPQYGDHEEYQHEVHEQVEEQHKPVHIPIIQMKSETHDKGYQFSYKTGNGIHAEESGYLKKVPIDKEHHGEEHHDEAIVMHGKVSYTGADGVPITLTYIADEHGFQPQGAHLPTPPPIPAEIQKALEQQGHGGHQEEGGKEEYGQEEYGQQYQHQNYH